MKIAVFGQFYHSDAFTSINMLLDTLEAKGLDYYLEADFLSALQEHDTGELVKQTFKSFTTLDDSFDLLISIGGDGTMLRAVTFVRDLNIAIVGINTGRLGFLATISKEKISEAIADIIKGNYRISERRLLSISCRPDNGYFDDLNIALNEIAVSRKNTTSMITVSTYLNGEYLTSYWADGLIVSTPTGSTGYSLSCGGPVVMPDSDNFVLTPIAPHNLNARPLVIPDSTEIELKVHGRESNFLVSLDSRIATLPNDVSIVIKKAPFRVQLIELEDAGFLKTLRQKLLWGEDRRN